jgi:hypothetical protein
MIEAFLADLGYVGTGPNSAYVFVLLTVCVGGWAAWRTGQAQAQSWAPAWPVVAYTAVLAAAVRFLHFALFSGPLLSPIDYLVDLSVLLSLALVGYRSRRAQQVTEQYPWLFERRGPLNWGPKRGVT